MDASGDKMDDVEAIVDVVIEAFDARRRTAWHATTLPLIHDRQELEAWREVVEARLTAFRHSTIDRDRLLDRVRERYPGTEWSVDFAKVADELQEMSRDDLQKGLIEDGMPAESAQRVARGYSIGAMLRES